MPRRGSIPRALLARAHRRHAAPRRPRRRAAPRRPAAQRAATWCAARPARRSASRRKSVRVRGVVEALLAAARVPRRARVHARRGAVARRHGRRRRRRLSRRRTAAASADSAADAELARRITLMVDSPQQLDLIDDVLPPGAARGASACASSSTPRGRAPVLGHLGVRRSPVHDPADAARASPRTSSRRPGFRLVGMMAYEAQIAGVGRPPAGSPVDGAVNRWMQSPLDARTRSSGARAPSRRVREHRRPRVRQRRRHRLARGDRGRSPRSPRSPRAAACSAATCSTATSTSPRRPAAAFALDVVRSPTPRHRDDPRRRLDRLRAARRRPAAAHRLARGAHDARRARSAGEVQTPVHRACRARRCASATASGSGTPSRGELVRAPRTSSPWSTATRWSTTVPTYRGEGKAFL